MPWWYMQFFMIHIDSYRIDSFINLLIVIGHKSPDMEPCMCFIKCKVRLKLGRDTNQSKDGENKHQFTLSHTYEQFEVANPSTDIFFLFEVVRRTLMTGALMNGIKPVLPESCMHDLLLISMHRRKEIHNANKHKCDINFEVNWSQSQRQKTLCSYCCLELAAYWAKRKIKFFSQSENKISCCWK